jgi:hypothetical protein
MSERHVHVWINDPEGTVYHRCECGEKRMNVSACSHCHRPLAPIGMNDLPWLNEPKELRHWCHPATCPAARIR